MFLTLAHFNQKSYVLIQHQNEDSVLGHDSRYVPYGSSRVPSTSLKSKPLDISAKAARGVARVGDSRCQTGKILNCLSFYLDGEMYTFLYPLDARHPDPPQLDFPRPP